MKGFNQVVGKCNIFCKKCATEAAQSIVEGNGCFVDIDNRIVGDQGVSYLGMAIKRSVDAARADRDRAAGSAIEIMEIIVDDRLAFTDDAYAARAIFSHAQKEIAFDHVVVALS